MKYDCDLICDLLPLYIDGACSKASSDAIEEHLAQCESCSSLCADMRKCEKEIDNEIREERDKVLTKQAKYFKRRSVLAGSVIGAIFSIPILVCLIVDLAAGSGLTWFFIVLTAMFIPASLTIVPLMIPENKGLWTLGAFTASLVTLLGVCRIYSGGSWFLIAASALIFGLSVPFAPFIANSGPVKKRIKKHSALLTAGIWTATYLFMMICIGVQSESSDFARYAFACSIPAFAWIWSMTLLITLPRWSKKLKTAACIFVSSLFFFFSDTIALLLLGRGFRIPKFDFTSMNAVLINDSIMWSALILGTIISAILGIPEILKLRNNKK